MSEREPHLSKLKDLDKTALDALRGLLAGIDTAIGSGELENVRAQLQAVSASIQKLVGKGVPVPDELRALKSSLLAREGDLGEIAELRLRLARELSQVLSKLGVSEPGGEAATKRRKKRKPNDTDQNILPLFDLKEGNG